MCIYKIGMGDIQQSSFSHSVVNALINNINTGVLDLLTALSVTKEFSYLKDDPNVIKSVAIKYLLTDVTDVTDVKKYPCLLISHNVYRPLYDLNDGITLNAYGKKMLKFQEYLGKKEYEQVHTFGFKFENGDVKFFFEMSDDEGGSIKETFDLNYVGKLLVLERKDDDDVKEYNVVWKPILRNNSKTISNIYKMLNVIAPEIYHNIERYTFSSV
jgi:hypothetical protein